MLSDVMLIAVMPFLNGFMVELLTCAALFVWELPRRPSFWGSLWCECGSGDSDWGSYLYPTMAEYPKCIG